MLHAISPYPELGFTRFLAHPFGKRPRSRRHEDCLHTIAWCEAGFGRGGSIRVHRQTNTYCWKLNQQEKNIFVDLFPNMMNMLEYRSSILSFISSYFPTFVRSQCFFLHKQTASLLNRVAGDICNTIVFVAVVGHGIAWKENVTHAHSYNLMIIN